MSSTKRVISRAAEAYMAGVHLGPHSDTCLLSDPHCDCRMGSYCKRLPPVEAMLADEQPESEDNDAQE